MALMVIMTSSVVAVPVSYECGDFLPAPSEGNRVLELHTGPGYALQACQNLLDVSPPPPVFGFADLHENHDYVLDSTVVLDVDWFG